jgi:hypothetical protein
VHWVIQIRPFELPSEMAHQDSESSAGRKSNCHYLEALILLAMQPDPALQSLPRRQELLHFKHVGP